MVPFFVVMKGIIVTVLSLFDGMSCGMIAMRNAGVKVDRYVAYEIDKYAIKTSQHNFPEIEHKGDVFTADFTQYQGFDFLIGGSPCTYWSIAKKSNRETQAFGMGWELFSQYLRALKEAKPKFFIYENNKSMSISIRDSIREAFGFKEICLNSSLLSAQNRQRFYWIGKRNSDGTYSKVNVEQPEDRGIILQDVLDNSRYSCPVCTTSEGKSFAVTATEYKGGNVKDTIKRHRRTQIAELVRVGTYPGSKRPECDSKQYRIYSTAGKAVTQCGQGGGLGAKTGLYAIPVLFNEDTPTKASGSNGKLYDVYRVKSRIMYIKGEEQPVDLPDGYYIVRKLTVSECKRLQTVPEWYEFPVSETQALKMLGNGWTCDIISHLIKSCLSN